MDNTILRTENLSVGYGGKVLIDNINITVNRGEIVALIGPNGSGKSTILKTITGGIAAISGSVYINGVNSINVNNKDIAKTMSILMTERIRTELMTCFEIVKCGRYPYTGQLGILSENDKQQIVSAMKMTAVEDLAEKDFNCISDGQKQRVMLARAICQEPEILVLDEPTSFLDIHYKIELLSILKQLVRTKNVAVLMSMHEIELAQRVADKIVCINNNKVERCGTPNQIFTGSYIETLYGLNNYNSDYGSVELDAPKGEPQIFVIAGGEKSIDVFRQLQRMNIPFATGVIHENDRSYNAAKALASEAVFEKPFEMISDVNIEKSMDIINKCKKVVCCIDSFGSMNEANKKLVEYAINKGIYVSVDSLFGEGDLCE